MFAPRNIVLCGAAILITSCGTATFTKSGSDATIESLRSFEQGFIDEFAVAGKEFDPAGFNAKVNEGNAKFQQAIAEEKFTARRPMLVDLKAQFDADAAHLRSRANRGTITPAMATAMKQDVNKIYDHALAAEVTAAPSPAPSASPTGRFPWPPPVASAYEVLPRRLLTGGNEKMTLENVGAKIDDALRRCGYVQRSYYEVPNGFAIASRIEHINNDGSFAADRWAIKIPLMTHFSLNAYLKALFRAPLADHYRVIVFVVTDSPFGQSSTRLTGNAATDLTSSGFNQLPPSIAQGDFSTRHQCTALIYEFAGGNARKAELVMPSEISADTHLVKAGLLAALAIH